MSRDQYAVGLDLGSSRFLVAVAEAAGVDVLVNQASYRQTPTAIVFGDQRTTGDKATALIRKDLDNSIVGAPRFLGELTHQSLQKEMNFNFCSAFFQSPGVVAFEVRLGTQRGSVRAEQLVAGLFSEAMGVLQFNELQPKEVVVSVPDSFGQPERLSLLAAARISGLPVTRLLNESSANALNYAVFRRTEFEAETPRVVCFVDVGHSKTTVSFAALTPFQIEMLSVHSHPGLGVRDLDLLLLQHYAQTLKQRFQLDLAQDKKLSFRLAEAVAKQRTALTINSDAPLTIECVKGDADFTHLLKRDELEKIGAPFFKALKAAFEAAFAALPRPKAKALHSVERVGGGCRIPAVERLISLCFKVPQVSKTLDASESIARGCALQSAMLAPKFAHSAYQIRERLAYPVTVKMQFEREEPKGQTLFEAGSELCRRVSVTIGRLEQVTLAVCLPSKTNFEERISSYTTIPQRQPGQELLIYFLLDQNGIVAIENAVVRVVGGSRGKNAALQPLSLCISRPGELSAQEIEAFQKLEVALLRQELNIQEKHAARNRLEELMYTIKNELGETQGVWGPTERARLGQEIERLESWLYGPGAAAEKDSFDTETNSLQRQLAFHLGRGEALETARALAKKLKTRLHEIQEVPTQKWLAMDPASRQRAEELLKEGSGLLADFSALTDRFSLAGLLAFDLGEWTRRAEGTGTELEQLRLGVNRS